MSVRPLFSVRNSAWLTPPSPHSYYRPNAGDTYRHFIQIKLVSPWMINRTTKLLETADEVGGLAPLFSAGKL